MKIQDFIDCKFVEIIDISRIKQGDYLWSNGEIVEIKNVDVHENRMEVWNKDKTLSELIYEHELNGVEKYK